MYASERRARELEVADQAEVEQAGRADGGRDARRREAARVRAGGRAARRDPADPAAGPRAGRVGPRGPGGGARGRADAALPAKERAAAAPARRGRPAARGEPGVRGHRGHGAAGGRGAGRLATDADERLDAGIAADCSRASATSTTTTTAAGRPAGSIGRPGTGRSPRTSAAGPASARRVAPAATDQPSLCLGSSDRAVDPG